MKKLDYSIMRRGCCASENRTELAGGLYLRSNRATLQVEPSHELFTLKRTRSSNVDPNFPKVILPLPSTAQVP